MSTNSRLAALEALARQNEEKIEELRHTNWLLNNHNVKTQEEIAKFEEDFSREHPNFDLEQTSSTNSRPDPPTPRHEPPVARHVSPARPQLNQRRQRPEPLKTPFYLAARDSSQLYLDFVIPGYRGETLEIAASNMDLAFILQQTLRRKGWSEERTREAVENFLAQPMMKVTWRGADGEFGNLS
jgi:hypothetical protein